MTKKVMKPLLGCIITAILTLVLAQHWGHILDPKWTEDGFNVIEAFELLEENSLDVIVYGSSHAWKGCDTRVMNDKYGLSAYNYGCNWQAINTILLFLKDSLRTQNPKVVCIEVGLVNDVLENTDLNGQIYYTKAMKSFEGKQQYLQQCFGDEIERYISYYFPIVMFHENWSDIDYENFRFPGPQRFVETRGYLPGSKAVPFEEPNYNDFNQYELSESSITVLDEIMSVCEQEQIRVLFYTVPWAGEYCYGDAMEEYAKKHECDYINFFKCADDINFDWSSDLQDAGHLNDSGSAKVAAYLAEYIIENYDVMQ